MFRRNTGGQNALSVVVIDIDRAGLCRMKRCNLHHYLASLTVRQVEVSRVIVSPPPRSHHPKSPRSQIQQIPTGSHMERRRPHHARGKRWSCSSCTARFITASYASGSGNRHVPSTGNATLTAFPSLSTSHTTGLGMLEAVGHSPNHGDESDSRLNCATTCTMSPVLVVCERTASLKSSVYSRNWHTTTDVGSKLSGTVPAGGRGADNGSGDCTSPGTAAARTSGAAHVA